MTNHVDVYDTTVSVWETVVDVKGLRGRVFLPLLRELRRRGWIVTHNPTITKNYPSLSKGHRLAWKGDLCASLELSGRHLEVLIWQERHGVTHVHGGRYEFNKIGLMPPALARRCRLEQAAVVEACVRFTGYPVRDRRHDSKATAEARINADIQASGHFDPTLGHARWHAEHDRRSADGVLLEHGQGPIWFADAKGRILRGQAFYSLNNMWWIKVGPRETTVRACHEIYATQPPDLRRRRNDGLRQRRLLGELRDAIERLDFQRAALLTRLLPSARTLRLKVETSLERGAA